MDSLSSDTVHSPGTYSSASKTSSKSSLAHIDEDFTRDNAKSPIDLDCSIQSERIIKIFNEAIYKIKLCICLPLLQTELDETSSQTSIMSEVANIYQNYENPLFSSSIQDMAVIEKLKAGDHSLKHRLNPELAHLISVLDSNAALRPMVGNIVDKSCKNLSVRSMCLVHGAETWTLAWTHEAVHRIRIAQRAMERSILGTRLQDKMKEGYVSYETKPASPVLDFLLSMEHFRDLMIRQTQGTAASLWAERVKTRKLEDSNAHLIKKIQECTKTIQEETEAFNKTMNIKSKIISNLEEALETHNVNAKYWLKKKIHYSDCQMVILSKEHLVNLELLKDENAQALENYEMVLKDNMLVEKNKRAQRFKYEVQLISWLNKYDTDMMDKQMELDEFIKNHEEESKKIEKLEVELAEIDKEYLPLMQEREDEYQIEMTEKMNQFMIEHAARVLQFAWKTVLANRIEKRKLQKEVKILKEAEEKRQRIADRLAAQAAAAAKKEAKKNKKKKRK